MLTAIIQGIITAASTLIPALKSAGVNLGNVGNVVLQAVNLTQTDEANYLAGQAVPLHSFSYEGKAGTILVVMNGGPAAQSLGL